MLERLGEAQVQLGVPVDQMLMAWRIGADVVLASGADVAAREGLNGEELLALVRGTLASSDLGMITTARGHRRAELSQDRAAQERRSSFVRALLIGTGDRSRLREQAEAYGLEPSRTYWTVRARPAPGESLTTVGQAIGLTDAEVSGQAMSVTIDGDLAGFLRHRPDDATPGAAGVGPAVPLEKLAESFRLASRALRTLHAFRQSGTHDIAGLRLRAAIADDADVGQVLRQCYLEPLGQSASARELISTLRTYLASGSHVETTAERLYIHPNTLRYRLSRYEELTGANLRTPITPFELWWAIESASALPDTGADSPGVPRS